MMLAQIIVHGEIAALPQSRVHVSNPLTINRAAVELHNNPFGCSSNPVRRKAVQLTTSCVVIFEHCVFCAS